MFISILSLVLNCIFDYLAVRVFGFGIAGVAAFAVVGYASYFVEMIIIGIGQGMTPLVSFAYGAKDVSIARKLCKAATIVSTVVGAITFVVMVLGRNEYGQFFIKKHEIQQMISTGILIFSGSFLLVGFNTMASFYYTAIGRAKESAVISMARGLVILLIALCILPQLLGINGVWLVAPVTEIITVVICLVYYKKNGSY